MKKVILSLVSGLLLFGCYDSMEILPTEELATSANSMTTLNVSYELTSNAYFDGGGISVTSPIPNIVKDIIINSFREFGQVIATQMYVTTCHFTFGIRPTKGYVDDVLVEQAMWNAECELERQHGVTFSRYIVDGYDKGWNPDTGNGSGSSSGGGSGGGSGSSSEDSSTAPEPTPMINPGGIENGTILNLYKKFYANSPTFKKVLKDFCAENSIAHLNWKTDSNLPDNVFGQFNWKMENYIFSISLNETKLINYPEVVVCKTMIHEAIHAKIFMDLLKVSEKPVGPELDIKKLAKLKAALTKQDFPTLFDYYEDYKDEKEDVIQHEYMGDYYIRTIASSLREISKIDAETATAIAWTGLKETKAWQKLSEADRNSYNTIYFNYCNNNKNIITP